jgi:hypothetical protein
MSEPRPPARDGASPTAFNGFGLAALILGIVGLGTAWAPVVNYASGVLPLAGVVLGVIGLVIRRYSRPLAIVGLLVSAVAVLLTLVLAVAYTVGFATAADSTATQLPERSGEELPAVITVEGTVDSAHVAYDVSTAHDDDTVLDEVDALPVRKEYTVAAEPGELDHSRLTVSAWVDDGDQDTSITCTITVDGEVVAQDTQTGPKPYAMCAWDNAALH